MKRSVCAVAVALACLVGSVRGESACDMLDRTLAGVVTVAAYKVAAVPIRNDKGQLTKLPMLKTRSASPYERVLDLSGAIASGSGFLIEHKGHRYIVTNAHVIAWATDDPGALAVFTPDRKRYAVKVAGRDPFYDIAVLSFQGEEPGRNVPTLAMREAATRVGEKVYALGNPLGRYPYSVSDGIIGGRNRARKYLMSPGYVQSTATVIWGNSGGPLVDASGNVVGVNTWIEITPKGGKQWIQPQLNFALESRVARRVVNDLLSYGRVRRAYFGLRIVSDYRIVRTPNGLIPDESSASQPTVASVVPGSPAAKALGDKLGAKIVRINRKPVRELVELLAVLGEIPPNSKVVFDLERRGAKQSVSVVAGDLTDKPLGDLGKHIFGTVGFTVAEGPKGLLLRRGRAGERPPVEPPPKKGLEKWPRLPGKHGPFDKFKRPAELEPFRAMDYKAREDGFRPFQRPPDNLSVIAIGLVNERGQGELYRTKELAELGIACRYTARFGEVHVAYLSPDGKSCGILKCQLSKTRQVQTRTVLH